MTAVRSEAMQLADWCGAEPSGIRFFVSKQWLNKLNTFAEPGPIDNWALLCPHGALPPNKAPIKSQLVVALPQPLWEYLYQKFGGGPACNHLYECDICRRDAEALLLRQNNELDDFQRYKDETTSTIYAISMTWLRQWQIFVGGGGSADDDPGPINNAAIANNSTDTASHMPIRSVRPGSDYAQINSSLWTFFYTIYGGGPVIILRGNGEELKEIKKTEKTDIVDETAILLEVKVPAPQQPVQPDTKKTDTDVAVDVVKESPQLPQKVKKVIKNVSFEDDGELNENSSIASSTQSTDTAVSGGSGSGSNIAPIYKRIKQHHYVKSPEIISKRDKRHRSGITSNGLFGPEGKF